MQRGLNPIKTLVGLGLRNRKRLAGGGRRERVKRLEDSERLRRLLAAPIFPLLSVFVFVFVGISPPRCLFSASNGSD